MERLSAEQIDGYAGSAAHAAREALIDTNAPLAIAICETIMTLGMLAAQLIDRMDASAPTSDSELLDSGVISHGRATHVSVDLRQAIRNGIEQTRPQRPDEDLF